MKYLFVVKNMNNRDFETSSILKSNIRDIELCLRYEIVFVALVE
jgi:hypothetical protein